MYQDPYNRSLDTQIKRNESETLNDMYANGYGQNKVDNPYTDSYSSYRNNNRRPKTKARKPKTGCFISLLILLAIFIVAIVKNPSEPEGKNMVKDYIVEKVNDKFREEMQKEENDGLKKFGAFLGMGLSSHLIDYAMETSVNDCFLFSTFNCKTKIEGKSKTIVSGIILFGKIIPLSSDIAPKKLNRKD